MKALLRSAVLSVLSLAAALPATATTYQMMSDATLADQAPVIAQVRVVSSEPAPVLGRRPATDYRVEVDKVLKGDLPGSTVVVRVPGGVRADGIGLKIWGAPEFADGEEALLFLSPAKDGTYRILHLMLGAFHKRSVGGRGVAVRDLSEAVEVGSLGQPGQTVNDPVRDLERFSDWLAGRAAGLTKNVDYLVADTATSGIGSATEKHSFMTAPQDGKKIRWFRFDQGGSVSWRVHVNGQPGLSVDATAEAFKVALQAWNGVAGTTIRYTYAGLTNAANGLKDSDGVNAILFDDPFRNDAENAVEGTFRCPGGGVIAMGGPFYYLSTRTYRGEAYHEAAEADIVTNDGTECYFRNNPRTAEEVFAHELGHTLGVSHSEVGDALMRPNAHNDGRGARLHADDRAAVLALYGDGTDPGTPPPPANPKPAAPTGLAAAALSGTQVRLTWTDNADNEQNYRVERRIGSGAFQEVQTVGANATQATVNGLTAGTAYSFRVRARGGSGFSAYSNTATVTTPAGPGGLAAPSGLRAQVRSANEVLLVWQDRATAEAGFRIERRTAGGAFQQIGTVPADTLSALIPGLTSGTSYGFRVRAFRAGEASAYSNTATVTTSRAAASAGCAGGDALCLLGGRFRVEVDWRDHAGRTGRGRLVRQSDKTGTAWFFEPANVELIVKVLDGTGLNGQFWVFAGALSDVEYWIKVTDLQTSRTRVYHNRSGDVRGFADTSAFAAQGTATPGLVAAREIRRLAPPPANEAPATSQAAAGACQPGNQALCLEGGRFRVEVRYRNQHAGGAAGRGTVLPGGGTGNTGSFWFFDPENTELLVKVLDGRALNGKFWVFSGALSDVEYWITVTDTATGRVRTYHNPPGNLAGLADTSAF